MTWRLGVEIGANRQETQWHTHTHIYIMGISDLDKGIGPWIAPEDVEELEDKLVLVKVSRLSG